LEIHFGSSEIRSDVVGQVRRKSHVV
jgi:hypothetical protein